MMRDDDELQLIPYASHVAHGTGRTPIGIILFAASHLLLRGVLVLSVGRFLPRTLLASGWMQLFAVAVVVATLSMLSGGVMLLMKGRGAWVLSVTSFLWLAACEAIVAALGVGWWMSRGTRARCRRSC